VFVSPKVREREAIRQLQGVLVLRGNGPAAQYGEHYRNSRNRQHAFALHCQLLLIEFDVLNFFFTS
jgi:hypothetical protein